MKVWKYHFLPIYDTNQILLIYFPFNYLNELHMELILKESKIKEYFEAPIMILHLLI